MGRTKELQSKENKFPSVRGIKSRKDRCANPLNLAGHRGKNLTIASKSIIQRNNKISVGDKICDSCRKKMYLSMNTANGTNHDGTSPEDFQDAEPEPTNSDAADVSVLEKGNLQSEVTSVPQVVNGTTSVQPSEINDCADDDAKIMIENLKNAFSSLDINDPLRIRILTIVPDHWSLRKTAREFNTTVHYARKAKDLLESGGLFAQPQQQLGKRLSTTTAEKIKEFYNSDGVCRVMPGIKDTISVKINGIRQRVQKKLLLLGLKELYVLFKTENPKSRVSFSMFAKLRPKNCILAGPSGTHCVCVCTIHQNVKMMLDAIDLKNLTRNDDLKMENYKDCLASIICSEPDDNCFLNSCEKCPGTETFRNHLLDLLTKSSVTEVKYAVWTESDRSTLLTVHESIEEFVDNLCQGLEKLKPHSYISKKQSAFIKSKKENLSPNEVLVCFDFSENYAFVVQDAAQAFHYNNDQSTVFPVLYYYKTKSGIFHKSCIFLSESTKHDTAAVYTVLTQLIPIIRKDVPQVKKIIYVSDGAKQHFKNRFQMANVLNHNEDFGISAEWHFTTTSHGKGGHDGLAACFKREARRASLLAKPTDAILNAKSLYSWGKTYFKDVKIHYFSKVEHEKMQRKLNMRFMNAVRVTGIMTHHSFKVKDDGTLEMQRYSVQ